jgi:hypothetical protein
MRLRIFVVFLMVIAVCGLALAGLPKYTRVVPLTPPDLNQDVQPPVTADTPNHARTGSLDDPVGTIDTVGMTWYDEQQWTTAGKQIAVDPDGYVHLVWTCGLSSTVSNRHAYYNVWDPTTQSFISSAGMQIDAASKAAYVNVAVNSQGFAFPSFHQLITGDSIQHTAVAYDFMPRTGGFTSVAIPNFPGRKILYPKISVDADDNLQTTATHGLPYNVGFYAKGVPTYDAGTCTGITWPDGNMLMDTTEWLTRDVATSIHRNRVALVWLNTKSDSSHYYFGRNLYMRTSDDGGSTWNDPINITNYPIIDTMCVINGGDTTACNGDTLYPGVDVSVIFDMNDVIHIAFTVRYTALWDETGTLGPWIHTDGVSSIWHWDEDRNEFNIIAERTDGTLTHTIGTQSSTEMRCQRPSLAIDTTTGYLYCSYQAFDTLQWSENGFLQGDAWVSVSTTNGRTWSAGTNVTNTDGGQETPAGQCQSERDITIAKFVSDGIIHMEYEFDKDAGTGINTTPEGTMTNNPMIYQRIPIDQIPARPLINPYRALRIDSTGYPFGLDTTLQNVTENPTLLPRQFVLHANYPNPFNPTTTIQYDLRNAAKIRLDVYDVLGRNVATLFDGMQTAGVHLATFDGKNLASGIYYYRLKTDESVQVRKMLLLK